MSKTWSIILGEKFVTPKNFTKATPLAATCPSLIYGVELEIENVPNWPDMLVPGITSVADGSLRNNGREFITQPMTYSNLAHCLGNFFTLNKLTKDNYSERCSIHVHTNCLNLTMDQIRTVLFLYQMCEKLLYSWVDPERYENIFCVPWSQTNITYQTLSDNVDPQTWKTWRKYTGLNLLPLYEHGTIEWRHMSGHGDVRKILDWCQIIGKLYSFALKNSLGDVRKQLLDLNTNSQYKTMLERVFEEYAPLFYQIPSYEQDLEDGVLNLKYASHNGSKKLKPAVPRPVQNNAAENMVLEANWMDQPPVARAAPINPFRAAARVPPVVQEQQELLEQIRRAVDQRARERDAEQTVVRAQEARVDVFNEEEQL